MTAAMHGSLAHEILSEAVYDEYGLWEAIGFCRAMMAGEFNESQVRVAAREAVAFLLRRGWIELLCVEFVEGKPVVIAVIAESEGVEVLSRDVNWKPPIDYSCSYVAYTATEPGIQRYYGLKESPDLLLEFDCPN